MAGNCLFFTAYVGQKLIGLISSKKKVIKKSWSFLGGGYSPLMAIFKNWVDKFVRAYLREFFRSLAWSALRPTQPCCPCLLAIPGSRRVVQGLSAMLDPLGQSVVTGTWHCCDTGLLGTFAVSLQS